MLNPQNWVRARVRTENIGDAEEHELQNITQGTKTLAWQPQDTVVDDLEKGGEDELAETELELGIFEIDPENSRPLTPTNFSRLSQKSAQKTH